MSNNMDPESTAGSMTGTAVSHLECSRTGERLEAGVPHNLSSAGWPLLVRYNLEELRRNWDRDSLQEAPRSMWRYAPALPVRLTNNIISLQEGFTPLHRLERLGSSFECDDMWLKDEGVNPTGSFKARGMRVLFRCAASSAFARSLFLRQATPGELLPLIPLRPASRRMYSCRKMCRSQTTLKREHSAPRPCWWKA